LTVLDSSAGQHKKHCFHCHYHPSTSARARTPESMDSNGQVYQFSQAQQAEASNAYTPQLPAEALADLRQGLQE
jgi:hypothetical protein